MPGKIGYFLYHWTEIFDSSRFSLKIRRRLNLLGRYSWENRKRDSSSLLLVVAGYKPELWPITLARIRAFLPPSTDVCVVSPGLNHPGLRRQCEDNGWSYLWTSANKLALAQNIAIQKHPAASWIHKLDEDMVIGEGYFKKMEDQFVLFEEKGVHEVGFLAPLINVNGFSSRIFLEERKELPAFENEFGVVKQGCMAGPVWTSLEAARQLWNLTVPFDKVRAELESSLGSFSLCPFRFSIGAFLMKRGLWEEMGGFTVTASGRLGSEEIDFCAWCQVHSRVIFIAHGILAGHCGFQSQTEGMIPYILDRKDLRPTQGGI